MARRRRRGRDALVLLRSDSRSDVVVADLLMMARINGIEVYEAVRIDHPGLERRFVFMTGGAFTSSSQRFLDTIPNRCIDKPFDGDELLHAIIEVIDRYAAAK